MCSFAENFNLPLGQDEKFVAVFAFDDQLISQRNDFRLKATGHPRRNVNWQMREERNLAQGIRGKRRDPLNEIDVDPLCLSKFNLRPIDAVSSAIHLHPRQQPEQPSWRNRHHFG